ncbi:hypothetical protein PC117_g14983 [Phytophthora cactorum]|uniref:Uncharacterized protein n=1 Tax=Phytophthora cactorum TaxID=29920 RepID=A0A8T1CQ38_9STRA|nr:hypothetical protein PC117_g14983 [Phytophthora cactorum]
MSGDEKVNQVVSQMQRDVATRDGERAAIYVATVRPAMASVRYVHAEHAQQRQDGGKRAGRDNKEQEDGRQAGEGTHQRQSLKPTKSWGGVCNKVSFTEMMDVHDDNSVAQIQLVRRRARKLAKRERVKRARARRRSTEREVDEELQRVAEEQDGNKSLKLLWKKWRSDSVNGETSSQLTRWEP